MFSKSIKLIYHNIFSYRKMKRIRIIKKNASIKETAQIQNDLTVIDPSNLIIEDFVYIGPNAKIQAIGGVKISRGVIIGPELRIYSANHRFVDAKNIPYDNIYIKKPVLIEENVWIGARVTIVPGTIIREGSIIGAGSVVSGEIPKMSIVVGNPAKIINKRDENHYYKLKEKDKIYLKLKQTNRL